MESYLKIKEIQKQNNNQYDFFLNLLNDDSESLFDKNLNLPKLPLIGCNLNENNQLIGKILGVICFQIDICQGEKKDEINSKYIDFNLPSNIIDYLNIDEVIEIDNNTDDKDSILFFMPKNKLNFYLIISELPKYDNKSEDFFLDDKLNQLNNNKINIIDNDNNYIDNYLSCNIIPQLYYCKDILVNLSEIGNLNFQKQITLFSLYYDEYQDIHTEKDKNYIEINNLRGENSNIEIKDNKVKFTPDNLKFFLGIDNNLSQFHVIITDFDQKYHSVFYYITCNNIDTRNKMKNILNKSNNLNDIIDGFENNYGKTNDVVTMLKEIFYSE